MNPFHDISTPYYFLFSDTYYYFAEENKFMAGLAQLVEQVRNVLVRYFSSNDDAGV